MFWIAAHQFAAHLRVQSLPESREVRCRLYRPLIGSEKMNHQRGSIRSYPRRVPHAEKILEGRCDPGMLAVLVVDFCLASILQSDAR